MPESQHQRYTRWQLREVLALYPELRIIPSDELLVLRGNLAFRVVGPDKALLEDAYRIEIHVPPDFPNDLPLTQEIDGRIPRSFHKLQGNYLCLGAPTEQRIRLSSSPTLRTYIEGFVIPYLYGYSIFAKTGTMPYGELEHGDDGIRQYLAGLFNSDDPSRAEEFVRCAAMKKRRANKMACPCGSGRRLGRCHNRTVNSLRSRFGRQWFWREYTRILESFDEEPPKAAVDRWLSELPATVAPSSAYGAA